VVTVADEVNLADPHEVDRGHRLAAPHRGGDLLPAAADAARGRAEATVEIPLAVDRAGNRVEPHHLPAERALTYKSQCGDDLLVRQDHANVIGLAAEPSREPRERRATARPQEVVLCVNAGRPG
jgi:hypothetical protein